MAVRAVLIHQLQPQQPIYVCNGCDESPSIYLVSPECGGKGGADPVVGHLKPLQRPEGKQGIGEGALGEISKAAGESLGWQGYAVD